jgi:hypothetical protein
MGVGRVLCVSVPFLLTAASLVTLLIVGLAGVTGSNLNMFDVSPQHLSISIKSLQGLTHLKSRDLSSLTTAATGAAGVASDIANINITAADLQLADNYYFYLWNYVSTTGSVSNKTTAKFNYASSFTNTTVLSDVAKSKGVTLDLPSAVGDGLVAFANLVKWTEVVFIVACITTALTLIVGLIGFCSRMGSCCTYIICSISTTAIIAFAALGTVTATAVVGTVKTVAEPFGMTAHLNTTWLGVAWVGAAASLAAGLFWLFSVCCCKSERKRNSHDGEKDFSGNRGYQRVSDPHGNPAGAYNQPQYGIPMNNVKINRAQAYEPYSHHAV